MHDKYIKTAIKSTCQKALMLNTVVRQSGQLARITICTECCNKDPWIREYQDRPVGALRKWDFARSIKSSQNCTLALRADFHVSKSKTRSQCTTKVGFAAFARRD
jgi:hypothetical protein